MIEVLKVKPIMTQEKAEAYEGEMLGDNDYIKLINYDCDVFCEETGQLLAKFRKNQIDKKLIVDSFPAFVEAAKPNANRGAAAGKIDGDKMRYFKVKKDGTMSKTSVTKVANSGVMGFMDRSIRVPYCRTTEYTTNNISKYEKCLPIIKLVSAKFKELVPDKWQYQKDYCDRTSQDFVINDTVFTTITVNKNWQTACHTDKGDLDGGFGNLVVMRKGKYTGGYFVLVKWGIAFDLQNSDILFTDVHQIHGNTPIHKLTDDATRISLVMYYRENMIACGARDQETILAKKRQTKHNLNKYE